MNAFTNLELSAVAITEVDVLGALLAQIEDLTAQAEAIKNRIKEDGADGKLAVEVVKGKEIKYVNGALFRATTASQTSHRLTKTPSLKSTAQRHMPSTPRPAHASPSRSHPNNSTGLRPHSGEHHDQRNRNNNQYRKWRARQR